jgi:hypothetical protein
VTSLKANPKKKKAKFLTKQTSRDEIEKKKTHNKKNNAKKKNN